MKNIQRILEYIAIALMVLNIVGYALHKSISCIALFGAGAYIARCFSKNLAINIFAGLLVSNVFFGCSSLREGFGIAELAAGLQAAVDEKAKEAKEATSEMNGAASEKVAAAKNEASSKINEAKQVIGTTSCRPNAKGEKWSLKYSTLQCAPHKNEEDCIKNMPQGNPYCEWK